MRLAALVAAVALWLPAPSLLAFEVEVLQEQGDAANRIDLVILGDGYRAEDQSKMSTDAQDFLAEYWAAAPHGDYQGLYNVHLVHVISNDNGADNGTYGSNRDTALGATFNCYNIDRLLCVDSSAVYQVAADHVPQWDLLMVMVNDPKYGGSGGSISVFSTDALAGQIAIHELGHSFGGLADEYEDAYPGYPTCSADCPEPNATNHEDFDGIKWNVWIDGSTPLPTPETSAYNDVVGLFEGARYFSSGVYRPKRNCTMRALGVPFCEVCQEALIWAAWNLVSPIDGVEPVGGSVNLEGCENALFSVSKPALSPDNLRVHWELDGQPLASDQVSLELSAPGLGDGSHNLRVVVEDLTDRVRRDPGQVLGDERQWTIQVADAISDACVIDGACIATGTVHPDNPCQVCDRSQDPTAWSPVVDGSLCGDDGLFCNGAEACLAGECVSGAAPCADDGLDCTETCDESSQDCNLQQAGTCLIAGACWEDGQRSPGNVCQRCDAALDSGDWTLEADGAECDDGDSCTADDRCQAGVCAGSAICSETCGCPEQDEVAGGCSCGTNRPLADLWALLALLLLGLRRR